MSEKIINYNTSTIAEMTNGIILANFKKDLSARIIPLVISAIVDVL